MPDLFSQSSSVFSQTVSDQKEQFLRFNLHPDTKVMLPISQITEVLKIKLGRIVPIPQMPAWVMGVYNWRGDILWMLDLGHLIGLGSWYQDRSHTHQRAIVLSPTSEVASTQHERSIHLGLIVGRVEDLEMLEKEQIQTARGNVSSQLQQFLQGYWLKPEGEMILVLDEQAIVAAMPKSH